MEEELLRAHVDALYGAPREDFVAERDRRVKDLKREGHREEAAALKGSRKPTVPAWVVDQLPRRDPETVEALIDAATTLRDLQRRAASGGAASLRDASAAFRTRVRELRELAEEVLAESGAPVGSHLDDVERTLTAAAADPDQHETLRRGVFARPLGSTGFGSADGLTLVPSPGGGGDGGAADGDGQASARAERERQERREQRRRLDRQRRDLVRSSERQRRRADRSATEAEELRERAEDAAAQAREDAEVLARIEDELAQVDAELDALPDA